ncbi:hypothetical protein Tco_0685540 [Tanacetum coccineum]
MNEELKHTKSTKTFRHTKEHLYFFLARTFNGGLHKFWKMKFLRMMEIWEERGRLNTEEERRIWTKYFLAKIKDIPNLPKRTGTQSNGFVGTKASDNAGQARKETKPVKNYILLPLWTADLPYSQDPKSYHDDGFKPSSDDGKKVDEDPRKESKCKDQEKEDNVNITSNVNTISSTVNAADTNEVNAVGGKTSIELPYDPNMPVLKDDSIFDFTRDDENDAVVADMNILDTTIQVSPNLTTRIHKDHPLDQVIGDLQSTTQKGNMSKNLKEHGFVNTIQQRTNHKDLQNYLFACFLSPKEPKKDPYVATVARWRSRVTTRPLSSSEFPITPVTVPPEIRRWSVILIRLREAIPFGRPYHTHPNGPLIGSLAPTRADLLPPHKRDNVEIDPRDVRDDTKEYEADTSAGDTIKVRIDPMSAPIVEEEIVEPAGEDSSDSYGTRDGIVRSFKDRPIDLNDVMRDFYHHMSEVRIDRIVGIETVHRRLEVDQLIAGG